MSTNNDAVNVDLAEGFDSLRKDVAKLVAAMSQLAQNQAQAVGSNVSDAVDGAAAKISDAAAHAKGKANSVGCEIEASIERNPMTALLIAFGIGLSIAVLSRSRS